MHQQLYVCKASFYVWYISIIRQQSVGKGKGASSRPLLLGDKLDAVISMKIILWISIAIICNIISMTIILWINIFIVVSRITMKVILWSSVNIIISSIVLSMKFILWINIFVIVSSIILSSIIVSIKIILWINISIIVSRISKIFYSESALSSLATVSA